jgi:hypothetical protein
MQFTRYEESSERSRLTGQLHPRGAQTGLPNWGMFLFGLPFFGVGLWATLAGTKLIPIDESKLHAPHWVLAMFGLVFALAGLLVWGMGWRQLKANRRRNEQEVRDPALADHPWDERSFTPPRWSRVVKTVGAVIFLTLFLSIFNWWAFLAKGPWPVKIIVGIFDLVLVCFVWHTVALIGRTIKFGPSRIEFAQFPYRPGAPMTLRWMVPRGMTRIAKGTFILRCVEEWYEVSGSGKDRSRHLVQETVWSATLHLDPQDLRPDVKEELRFNLPADAPGTRLSVRDTKPIFWELAVDLDVAGLDFKETYMVPVYAY